VSGERPVVVLVDAENVRRSLWPNLSERELVRRCRSWAEREHVRATVVFDRGAPGAGDERCLVVEARPGETADDWIAREAASLRGSGERFWLVTSDRALRAEAGRDAGRVIGGGSFARELLDMDPAA
jgi:predicted RNA-binding protein with PIN domain